MARKLRKKRVFFLVLILCLIISLIVGQCVSCGGKTEEKKKTVSRTHLNDTLRNNMSDSPDLEEMETTLKRYFERWELNGAQIAVSRNDSLI